MTVGMLWQGNFREHTFDQVVGQALAHYQRKYRRQPDTVHAHPKTVPYKLSQLGGLRVECDKLVQPGCLWLGREEDTTDEVYRENTHARNTDT